MYSLYEVENKYHSRYMGTYFTIEECCAIIEHELDIKINIGELEVIKSYLRKYDDYIVYKQYDDFEYTYKIVKGE